MASHRIKLSLYFSGQSIGYHRSLQQMIGSSQIDLEQFEASIASYRKALELVEKSSEDQNAKDINKGDIMQYMAMGYKSSNNLKEAIVWYTKSLDIKEKSEDSPLKNHFIAILLIGIGTCYQELGEFQIALDYYYEKAREKLQKDDVQAELSGSTHVPIGLNLTTLAIDTKRLKSLLSDNEGLCHYELGRYEKALEVHKNALAILKQINATAEDMALTLNNIANVLHVQGKYQEAMEMYKDSLEWERERSGQDANNLVISLFLHNIGVQCSHLKDYQEAGKWFREALSMKQSIYRGKNQPGTSFTLNSIGLNYYDQGDLEKAKDYIKRAYDMILTCEGNDERKSNIKRNLDEVEKKLELSKN